jgi:uncharacterized membrane protein YedE/YeeE
MRIDWLHFTPWDALAGGILIGLATALLLIANGRVAGISGILGGLLRPARGDIAWRLCFVIARLSPRSLLATACFMAAGFITVFVVRHVVGH